MAGNGVSVQNWPTFYWHALADGAHPGVTCAQDVQSCMRAAGIVLCPRPGRIKLF